MGIETTRALRRLVSKYFLHSFLKGIDSRKSIKCEVLLFVYILSSTSISLGLEDAQVISMEEIRFKKPKDEFLSIGIQTWHNECSATEDACSGRPWASLSYSRRSCPGMRSRADTCAQAVIIAMDRGARLNQKYTTPWSIILPNT